MWKTQTAHVWSISLTLLQCTYCTVHTIRRTWTANIFWYWLFQLYPEQINKKHCSPYDIFSVWVKPWNLFPTFPFTKIPWKKTAGVPNFIISNLVNKAQWTWLRDTQQNIQSKFNHTNTAAHSEKCTIQNYELFKN